MKAMGPASIAIVPSARPKRRSRDVEFPFHQDSDFHYLTGFPEPEAVAVLLPRRAEGSFVLFCRAREPEKELWDGPRAGPEGARKTYGADQAFPISELGERVPKWLEGVQSVYYAMGSDAELDRRMMEWVNQIRTKTRAGTQAPREFMALDQILHEHRVVKSRAELSAMRRAARVTADAHRAAMRLCRPGLAEYQLEAEFTRSIMNAGCRSAAYPSIVATGKNACVLHYTDNDQILKAGELVLIDAGAEFDGYAADVTRTFPVTGEFSAPQRELYEVVLEAQRAAIAKVRPGNRWNDPHDAAVRVITRGLLELGLLKGRLSKLVKDEAYKKYFMHRTGHWLGLDVHDVGSYRLEHKWRLLEPGMVMTVEPGVYVAATARGAGRHWAGTGIRIEDDVAVTADGHAVLTDHVPTQPDAIEALMAGE